MRFHYDWEFKENGKTIQPISLGMVAESGDELYIISKDTIDDFRYRQQIDLLDPTDFWLQENVYRHISFEDEDLYGMWNFHLKAGPVVHDFIMRNMDGQPTELWGYYAAYDHVCLAQLFGKMIDLPTGIPMFTNELMTIRNGQPLPVRPSNLTEHHALNDAKYQKLIYDEWSENVPY